MLKLSISYVELSLHSAAVSVLSEYPKINMPSQIWICFPISSHVSVTMDYIKYYSDFEQH